jgi:hypothetical protein
MFYFSFIIKPIMIILYLKSNNSYNFFYFWQNKKEINEKGNDILIEEIYFFPP